MPPAAAVIVSRAKACARSARATPAGGCRRLLALSWPLTGTISRQRSITGEHIELIVSVQSCSSRHRPCPTTKMAAGQVVPNRAAELVHCYQRHTEQTGRSLGAANSTRAGAAQVIPGHRHLPALAVGGVDPSRLGGRGALPVHRWLRGVPQPHLACRPVRFCPLPV